MVLKSFFELPMRTASTVPHDKKGLHRYSYVFRYDFENRTEEKKTFTIFASNKVDHLHWRGLLIDNIVYLVPYYIMLYYIILYVFYFVCKNRSIRIV